MTGFSLVLLFLYLAPLTAPAATDKMTDAAVERYRSQRHIPGVSIAIVKDGKLVYSKGFGKADLENDVPVSDLTLFQGASTQKTLTATAILQLAEAGKIDLDAPAQKYCAAYPEKKWPVLVRQLLYHTAGIQPSTGATVFNREHHLTVNDAVKAFSNSDLKYQPGTKTTYSNDGYTLLACVIEGASGQTYDDYLRAHVLSPSGMSSMQPDNWYKIIPHRARSYVVRSAENTKAWEGLWTSVQLSSIPLDTPVNADPVDPTNNPGATGYVTNPVNLARLIIALEAGKLLKPESLREMMTDKLLPDGSPTGYGFGWRIAQVRGERALNMFGSVWTGSSAMMYLPDRHFAVCISTNVEFEQPLELATEIAALWGEISAQEKDPGHISH